METICLVEASASYAEAIEDYRAEFPSDMKLTYHAARIPGLSGLEDFESVGEWLEYCESMCGKTSWYVSIRESDGRMVGAVCLRHALEYDDDDIEFASHIGYSVRPSEQGKGYGREQLRLALGKARKLGIERARIVCRDTNAASNATIRSAGGVYVDSVTGELSGLTVNRYDVVL